jgi:hypothetical protein
MRSGLPAADCTIMPQVNGQLQQLPPPPSSDASLELFRRLRSLSELVRDAVQGRDDVAFFRAATATTAPSASA